MNRENLFTETISRLEHLVVAEPAEAIQLVHQRLPDIDQRGSLATRLTARRLLAMAYAHTSQFSEALQTVAEALDLPDADDEPIECARLKLSSMQPLAHLGRIDEAISAGREAVTAFESVGNEGFAGRAALNTGAILAMTGRHEEALESFDYALQHLNEDALLSGQVETNRGLSLAAVDRFIEAEAAFSRAGELTGEKLPWASAIIEENLGDLSARQGAINRSLKHFETARRYLEEDEALGDLGRLEADEASVLALAGIIAPAQTRYKRALKLLEEHGTPGDLAAARVGYARVLIEQTQLQDARELLQSLRLSVDPEEDVDTWQQYLTLAVRMALMDHHFDIAAELIASGKDLVQDRPIQRLAFSRLHAQAAYEQGDIDTANEMLQEALIVSQRIGVTPLTAEINEALSELARHRGDDDAANDFARQAIDGYESIRGTILADQLRQTWHQNRLGAYGSLTLSLLGKYDEPSQREAFDIAERIRSRALLDSIGGTTRDTDSNEPGDGGEGRLVEELNGHRRWLNWTYSAVARGGELSPQQLIELKSREQTVARLEDRVATLKPQTELHQPLSIDDVQQRIRPGSAILSYLVIGEHLTMQVITSDQIHGVEKVCNTSELSELVSTLQFQVGRALASATFDISERRSARLRRDMDSLLERMYDVLIAPVETHLEGLDRLVVVPSGDLHSVPFAALHINGRYLGETYALATAPSVSVHANMEVRERGSETGQHLIIGVPDEAAPGMGVEAKWLEKSLPNGHLLLGEGATRSAVTTLSASSSGIHFACHGRFDPMLPGASGLKLSDGWLTLADLRHLRLQRPLVVLSGCETGRARVDRGDDLVGLLAGFVSAGAGALVTSLWMTHDEAALALVESFYEALEEGYDLARALQISQSHVRAKFAHPAMWAPFIGLGNTGKEGLYEKVI